MTIFRIVQECVTNIHLHSGSRTAHVGVYKSEDTVIVEVTDQGIGMTSQTPAGESGSGAILGVGITGMRERVKQLGGHLEIESSPNGTTVQAILPCNGVAA